MRDLYVWWGSMLQECWKEAAQVCFAHEVTCFEGTRYNLAEAPFFKTDPATRRYTQLGVMLQMNGGGDVAEIKLGSA